MQRVWARIRALILFLSAGVYLSRRWLLGRNKIKRTEMQRMKHMFKNFEVGRYGIELCNTILAFSLTFKDSADAMRTRYFVAGFDKQTKRLYIGC